MAPTGYLFLHADYLSCITASGMLTSQLSPSGSNFRRASPCNCPGSACSMSRDPKLLRVGSLTNGPPLSFQCSLKRFSAAVHDTATCPSGTDSAPYFPALVRGPVNDHRQRDSRSGLNRDVFSGDFELGEAFGLKGFYRALYQGAAPSTAHRSRIRRSCAIPSAWSRSPIVLPASARVLADLMLCEVIAETIARVFLTR